MEKGYTQTRLDALQDYVDGDSAAYDISGTATISSPGIYYCNGTFTVTLNVSIGSGRLVVIKNIGVGTITISGGGINIDDTASKTITTQWASYSLRYSASNGKYLIE